MKSYKYKARNKEGRLKEGIVRADSPQQVTSHLKEMGMTLISLEERGGDISLLERMKLTSRVSHTEIMVFTRQMYALTRAGLPLVSGLKAIEDTATNRKLRMVLEEVRRDIESGSSLSAALSKHPRVFNNIYCSVVKAGEASGTLPEVLKRLAVVLENEQETRARIKQAMSYPVIVISVIIVALLALGFFVLPRFTAVFANFGMELPIFTRLLIKTNEILKNYWYGALFVLIVIAVVFRYFIRTPFGKLLWHTFLLKMFIFGPLSVKIYMGRFAGTIATLIKTGVPIVETLELSSKTTNNVIIFGSIDRIKNKVKEGKTISSAMREESIFPPLVVQMVSAGEESGSIDELMEMVADYYDREADYTIRNLTMLIEPLLLLIIASMVLVLALGIFLPIWNMSKIAGQ